MTSIDSVMTVAVVTVLTFWDFLGKMESLNSERLWLCTTSSQTQQTQHPRSTQPQVTERRLA